jgi:beta-fructofuranosidase
MPIPKPTLDAAETAIQEAVPKAEADPSRPCWHFRPPSQWMNDPNGTILHNGWYHLFYQHNPYYGHGWTTYWGHARSRDLVHWEHMPIALWPSTEKGEEHCWSGCAAVNAAGRLALFYTSIGNREPQQWMAESLDDELLRWEKHAANPILTRQLHGGLAVAEWRDPFVFREAGRTFMLLGGKLSEDDGGNPVCLIYESHDPELAAWQYRGIFYRNPKRSYPHLECPNLCKLGDKWLLVSAYEMTTIEYAIGSIDWTALAFHPERVGTLDHGRKDDSAFYATNLYYTPDGRTVLVGWVKGFKEGRGWNGCLSLPRVLSIAADGGVLQTPVAEIESLRRRQAALGHFSLSNSMRLLENVEGDSLEILLIVDVSAAEAFSLELRRSPDGRAGVPIRWQPGRLDVHGMELDLTGCGDPGRLALRIFLDKSVMEVFVNGGRECVTRLVFKREYDQGIALTAQGLVNVQQLDVWQMQSVW